MTNPSRTSLVTGKRPKPVTTSQLPPDFFTSLMQNVTNTASQVGQGAGAVPHPAAQTIPAPPGPATMPNPNAADSMQLKRDLMFGRHVGWGHDNMTPADKWAGMFTSVADRAGMQTNAPSAESMHAAGPDLMSHLPPAGIPNYQPPMLTPQSPELTDAMRPPGTPGAFGQPAENPGIAMRRRPMLASR